MKLSQLAAKPKLVEVILDDEDTVKQYGEPLVFHTWDRQPLEIFTKLAAANQSDIGEMVNVVRRLILDEKGKEVIIGETMLPPQILIKAIAKIVQQLGN